MNRKQREAQQRAKRLSKLKREPMTNKSVAVKVRYPHPGALIATGPLLKARWMVPEVLAEARRKAGQPVPDPIAGFMLIDTGASNTAIGLRVAQALGLTPVRLGRTYGAGGLHQNAIYAACLETGFMDGNGEVSHFRSEIEVSAIPDLDKALGRWASRWVETQSSLVSWGATSYSIVG
jgi:hypothetical protein